jgi:hypothetical protein
MLKSRCVVLFVLVVGGQFLASRSFLTASNFHSVRTFHRCSRQDIPRVLKRTGIELTMILEVEQKFRIDLNQDNNADICSKLEELGFQRKDPTLIFTDWYYDDLSSLSLSLQDCWLRYREIGGHGQWQLKRGQKQLLGSSNNDTIDKSTVYEEIIGIEAVDVALSIINPANDSDESTQDSTRDLSKEEENETLLGYVAPTLPTLQPHSLKAFVRLVTTRSSWISLPSADDTRDISENGKIKVDFDTTNTNYAVGEVETVVEAKDQVPRAQATVQGIIEKLQGKTQRTDSPPIGKLENFLLHFRPNHFQALVEGGILKSATPRQERG